MDDDIIEAGSKAPTQKETTVCDSGAERCISRAERERPWRSRSLVTDNAANETSGCLYIHMYMRRDEEKEEKKKRKEK